MSDIAFFQYVFSQDEIECMNNIYCIGVRRYQDMEELSFDTKTYINVCMGLSLDYSKVDDIFLSQGISEINVSIWEIRHGKGKFELADIYVTRYGKQIGWILYQNTIIGIINGYVILPEDKILPDDRKYLSLLKQIEHIRNRDTKCEHIGCRRVQNMFQE